MSNITKKALESSLKKLLMQKPLHKITINDITDECGVNRMTFYYHFKDIYDLVEWIFNEDADKVLKSKKSTDSWQEALMQVFEIVISNKILILNVYHSISHEQVENYLNKLIYGILIDIIEKRSEGIEVSGEDKKFIADFYKYAFTGVILSWVKNDMKGDPQAISEKLVMLMQGNIANDLSSFNNRILSKPKI